MGSRYRESFSALGRLMSTWGNGVLDTMINELRSLTAIQGIGCLRLVLDRSLMIPIAFPLRFSMITDR